MPAKHANDAKDFIKHPNQEHEDDMTQHEADALEQKIARFKDLSFWSNLIEQAGSTLNLTALDRPDEVSLVISSHTKSSKNVIVNRAALAEFLDSQHKAFVEEMAAL